MLIKAPTDNSLSTSVGMVCVDFVRFVEAVLRIRIQIWSDPKLFAGSGVGSGKIIPDPDPGSPDPE
jgi:hypothetical protein